MSGDGRRVDQWQLELTADVGGPMQLTVARPDVFIVSSALPTRQIYMRTDRGCLALTGSVLDLTAWSVVSPSGTGHNHGSQPCFSS